jgi:pyruvate, water dikinase
MFLEEISKRDTAFAGGKGANLGEMFRFHLPVPEAFIVTTKANEAFRVSHDINRRIERIISKINLEDIDILEVGARSIRSLIESFPLTGEIAQSVGEAYDDLCRRTNKKELRVAVRSSATAEDLRDASFAGQQTTLLNVRGKPALLSAIKRCWASVYTARAMLYRAKKGFGTHAIATAVVVQRQIASERAGVGFTIHPMSGDTSVIVIEGGFGQGESIVSGSTTPDTFVLSKDDGRLIETRIAHKTSMKALNREASGLVTRSVPKDRQDKPCLDASELRTLWSVAKLLEDHYGHAQDFEWAIEKGRTYLVQTRAVTVTKKEQAVPQGVEAHPILKGLAASPGWGSGAARLILKIESQGRVKKGDVLVTKVTTPDLVPAMLKASAIITDEGGMTSHAAIVSRELGVPCVVGTSRATELLRDGEVVTVDGSGGAIFRGDVVPKNLGGAVSEDLERTRSLTTATKVYMNMGVPEKIRDYSSLPFDGIGLMRIEFIIASYIGEHPLHLIETNNAEKFVDKLVEGIATVARAIAPRPLVVRFSDFKSNEYRGLQGGEKYEDIESNPMIGWRGVSRYIAPEYAEAFRMEVMAVKKVRDQLDLKNVWVMLPFVRTVWEVERCLGLLAEEGLQRGDSFKVWLMAEVPSVIFMADEFARLCDGFSIGSNDLTQLVLGIDRDSSRLAKLGYFDERDESVKRAIRLLVESAHRHGKTVSICGQAPSVYPDFAEFLVGIGIDSLSVNPDSVVRTKQMVHALEQSARGK